MNHVQKRLRGQTQLAPVIDLSKYHFNAVIDWIEFRVHFGRATQVQHVQWVLRHRLPRNSYINAEDKASGDVFTKCTIRIQEPQSLAAIALVHQDLVEKFGESSPSQITAIEVSIDAFPKAPCDHSREIMLGAMQRTIWTSRDIWKNPNSRPRSVFGRGSDKIFKLSSCPTFDGKPTGREFPEGHSEPFLDGTMVLGARDDDVMIKIMDKIKDGQRPDGTFVELSDEQKRTRIEVTIKGQELSKLGISDIESLGKINLQGFQQRYFQFRMPTFMIHERPKTSREVLSNLSEKWRADVYLRSGVASLVTMDRAIEIQKFKIRSSLARRSKILGAVNVKPSGASNSAARLVSWAKMNRCVVVALQCLQKREYRAWKRAKNRLALGE